MALTSHGVNGDREANFDHESVRDIAEELVLNSGVVLNGS